MAPLKKITAASGEVVLLGRSGVENRRNYNGKHKSHGLLFLALTDETGNLLWISGAH